jgi:hypothetical protein
LQVRWFNYGVGESSVDGTLVKHVDEVWYRLSLDAKVLWPCALVLLRDTYNIYP